MKNVLLICRKELRSYFASPIAYAVMAIFGLIFGWVFFNASRDFVRFTLLQSQEGPVSVNDSIIRPLLGFAGTIGLFLIPMITMRLFAE
jgi:ABC-2 type transport system permease protein